MLSIAGRGATGFLFGKNMDLKPNNKNGINLPDETLKGMVKRRAAKADGFWQSKFNLKKLRENNQKLYDTSYLKDRLRDENDVIYADNRLFTSVRTILPFATQRIPAPEVLPGNDDDESMYFARDFEKILKMVADDIQAKAKIRLAIQDLLKGQRIGIVKFVYNNQFKRLELKYVEPNSIILDHTAALYEEPKFLQETEKRSLADIIRQFPDKKDEIFMKYNIQKGVRSQLEDEKDVTESWLLYDDGEKSEYMVIWMLGDMVLGSVSDPNWMNELPNINAYPMVPYIFFNVLSDGTNLIDNSSFIEQAMYNQENYDRLGQRMVEDAQYGGIGIPVFSKGAIKQDEAAKVVFSPEQRLILDSDDVGKSFTTWQAGPMPSFMINEKQENRDNVDNIFGTPNVFRGEQSANNTATQDVLIRNQAEGRQAELIDAIEWSMDRFYKIESMMIYRYFDEEKYFRYKGDDGKLVKLKLSQEKIAQNYECLVSVQAQSGTPLDESRKRATAVKLLEMNRLGTLDAYRMLGVEDPEGTFKRYIQEQVDPKALLDEVDKSIFDYEAQEDIDLVIAGEPPEERDDYSPEYIKHLHEYLLTDKYNKLTPDQQLAVSHYVQQVIGKAQQKLEKLSNAAAISPSPMPGEVPPEQLPPAVNNPNDVQPEAPVPGMPTDSMTQPQPEQVTL